MHASLRPPPLHGQTRATQSSSAVGRGWACFVSRDRGKPKLKDCVRHWGSESAEMRLDRGGVWAGGFS